MDRAGAAEDRGEVLVGQLGDVGRLLVAEGAALGVEGVVVAAVEVLPAERQLVEAGLALLGGEDEAPVLHEARQALHVQLPGELADAHLPRRGRIGLEDVQVRVRLGRVLRGALRAGVVERGAVVSRLPRVDANTMRSARRATGGLNAGSKSCSSRPPPIAGWSAMSGCLAQPVPSAFIV